MQHQYDDKASDERHQGMMPYHSGESSDAKNVHGVLYLTVVQGMYVYVATLSRFLSTRRYAVVMQRSMFGENLEQQVDCA